MPDRFFLSNFDPRVLLSWIQDVRLNLLSLNRINPDNANSIWNADSAKLYLENKALTYAYYTTQKYEQEKQNKKALEKQQLNTDISNEYKRISVEEIKSESDRNLSVNSKAYTTIRDANNLIDKDPDIQQYRSNNQFDAYGINDGSTPVIFQGTSPFTTNTDTGLVSTTNEEVFQETNQRITNHLNELTLFTTKTGFKNKNKDLDKIFKSWVKIGTDGKVTEDPNNTFTPSSPYSKKIDSIIQNMKADQQANAFQGSYKFFIEKLHGRNAKGPYKKNKVKSSKVKGLDDIPEELSNRMVFAAYIDNFYDDYNVSWSDYNFIGRGEKVPVYKNTTRSLTLVFDIISDHSTEYMLALEKLQNDTKQKEFGLSEQLLQRILESRTDWGLGYQGGIVTHTNNGDRIGAHIPGIISDTPEGLWTKMTFLAQCAYPYYRIDGKMKEQPMIRLRIADFYDVIGTVESISVELNEVEGIQIDLNPSTIGNIPLFAKINMKITIYHDYEPSSNFYGFYHRREFDNNEIDKVTGVKTKASAIKKSPAEFIPSVKEDPLKLPSGFENYFNELESDLQNFKTNFTNLKSTGLKLKDSLFKKKFKDSIESYNKVQSVASEIQKLRGEGDVPVINSPSDLKTNVQEFKNNFDLFYGNLESVITNTKTRLQKTNQDLSKLGINLMNNDKVEALAKAADNLTPKKLIPKTLGDILDNIKK